MKNTLIRLIVLTMLFSILPDIEKVKAVSYDTSITTENITEEIAQEIKEDFGEQVSEELEINAELSDDNLVSVTSEIDTEDVSVFTEFQYDIEDELMQLKGIINEEGDVHEQDFYVILHNVEGNNFTATLIDKNTGEIYDIDTLEGRASALPIVIIAAVARYGISWAAKKYGKKAVTNIVKKQSYGKVLSSVSKLDKNKINHIMQSKHNWHLVTGKNWNDVSKVISHVMRYGKESAYKSVRKKTLTLNGKTVTVTFTRVKGEIRISDAWVNK